MTSERRLRREQLDRVKKKRREEGRKGAKGSGHMWSKGNKRRGY